MDINIKHSFDNVREDIFNLKSELFGLSSEVIKLNERLLDFSKIIEQFHSEMNLIKSSYNQIMPFLDTQTKNKTNEGLFQTDKQTNQTETSFFKPLNAQNLGISIGNKGVSTDKQTNRQTDKSEIFLPISENLKGIDEASGIIESLDNIKKELRLKFKGLTDQEIVVFSAIYQLEEEKGYSDYKSLSSRLNLSESSIRDYVRRLLGKDIPLDKIKINNKEIRLNISPNLKKIASLDSILTLRDL